MKLSRNSMRKIIITTISFAILLICVVSLSLHSIHSDHKSENVEKSAVKVRMNTVKQIRSSSLKISSINGMKSKDVKKNDTSPDKSEHKDEPKHEESTPQVNEPTPQVKEEVPQPEPLKRTLVHNGVQIKIGQYFGALVRGDVENLQNYINSSPWTNVGIMYNEPFVDDGVGTYLAGHNPGVFAPLTDLQIGSSVTVYDDNGNSKDYVVKRHTSIYNGTDGPIAVNSSELAEFINAVKSNESLMIQFCIGPDLQLFYLE